MGHTIPARLVAFAQLVQGGMPDTDAARKAGYSASYAQKNLADILARARGAGLLVDPATVRATAAAQTEAAVDASVLFGDKARAASEIIVGMATGDVTPNKTQLAAAIYVVNQVIGPPRQAIDHNVTGDPVVPAVFRPARPEEAPPE